MRENARIIWQLEGLSEHVKERILVSNFDEFFK
jgi:hypothetical protein